MVFFLIVVSVVFMIPRNAVRVKFKSLIRPQGEICQRPTIHSVKIQTKHQNPVLRVGGVFPTVFHGWVSVVTRHLRFQSKLNCVSTMELDSSSSARLSGDHQKVPDPVPAARGGHHQ